MQQSILPSKATSCAQRHPLSPVSCSSPAMPQPPGHTSSSPMSIHTKCRARFSGIALPPLPSAAGIMLLLLKDYVIRASRVMTAAVSWPAVLSLFFYLSATDRAVTDPCCYYELNPLVSQDAFPNLPLASLFSKKQDPWGYGANPSFPSQNLGSLGRHLIHGFHFFVCFNFIIDWGRCEEWSFILAQVQKILFCNKLNKTKQSLCFKTYLSIAEQTQILKPKIFIFVPPVTLQSPTLTQNFISQLCLEEDSPTSSDFVAAVSHTMQGHKQHLATAKLPSPSCIQPPHCSQHQRGEDTQGSREPQTQSYFCHGSHYWATGCAETHRWLLPREAPSEVRQAKTGPTVPPGKGDAVQLRPGCKSTILAVICADICYEMKSSLTLYSLPRSGSAESQGSLKLRLYLRKEGWQDLGMQYWGTEAIPRWERRIINSSR